LLGGTRQAEIACLVIKIKAMNKQIHPNRKAMMTNLKNPILVRNMIIATALCVCYLVGKHYRAVQNSPAAAIAKVNSTKANK
jgi:hypothetical protein